MDATRIASHVALDVTTTEFALAVRDEAGHEDYAAVPMRGGAPWQGDTDFPAFDLREVPRMLGDLLAALQNQGWRLARGADSPPGYLSIACRQHDMVLLDKAGEPLLPAISWQCNAAVKEVASLSRLGVEKTVGKIEPRFVLPKLACVLNRQPSLRDQLGTVLMTGDWVAYRLTGARSLSTSDALSNGLLDQQSRQRADGVIQAAGFELGWFPAAVQSGEIVGPVKAAGNADDPWSDIRRQLAGWQFVAGLGDNHASAVGCGMTDDYRKLVVSGGTSGTINLSCPKSARLPDNGQSLRFEFYKESLLLLQMLADCGAWYNRFLDQFAAGQRESLADLNDQAAASDPAQIRRVLHDDVEHTESFPPDWPEASLGSKVASTQFSIVLELLLRVKRMVGEVRQAGVLQVDTYVLTGGLSQSRFFQHVFYAGVKLLAPEAHVKVSGRTGPLRYKTSSYGALINAELPQTEGGLAAIHTSGDRFPLIDCAAPDADLMKHLQQLLASQGI